MKQIIVYIFLGLALGMLQDIYGKSVAVWLSDTFQKSVCANDLCINKPKGWVPVVVKRDDAFYIYNIINEKYTFWNDSTHIHSHNANVILLTKDNLKIQIEKLPAHWDEENAVKNFSHYFKDKFIKYNDAKVYYFEIRSVFSKTYIIPSMGVEIVLSNMDNTLKHYLKRSFLFSLILK